MAIEIIIALIKAVAVVMLVLTFSALMTWAERKQSAMMQDRIGVNRAKIFGLTAMGLFHIIADAVKMMVKEEFIPSGANRILHTLAPAIAMFPPLVVLAVMPFAQSITLESGRVLTFQVANLNMGILFILAFTSLGIYGAAIGGWASNNKFSILGAMRSSAQVFSYEIALGLAVVGVLMIYGTLELDIIVRKQQQFYLFGFIPAWGIVTQPIAFLLFLTASIAESKRIPFDLPEGESEIIAGYNVEYSGLKWGMFYLGEFAEIVVISALITVLFLGGWHIPWAERFLVKLPLILTVILQIAVVIAKIVSMIWLQLLIRWTFPRFRYDQLMSLGWKKLIPIGLLNIFITGLIILIRAELKA